MSYTSDDMEAASSLILNDYQQQPVNDTLDYLVRRLLAAKRNEEAYRATRIALEGKVAALIPGPERGSKTVKLIDGSRVTIERGYNYRADGGAIQEAFAAAGIANAPIKIKTTVSLDEVGYEWTKIHSPSAWAVLNGMVVVTPKKISIVITPKK